MSQHSYSLQHYAGVSSRYTCPSCGGKRCFTLYVDESGKPLDEKVGRCDHESGCGYHYTPKEYFRGHPDLSTGARTTSYSSRNDSLSKPHQSRQLFFIPGLYVTSSVRISYDSHLTSFLRTIIPIKPLDTVLVEYKIGVTRQRDTIYFQIDKEGRCRTGKIMKYNPNTGHRIKDEHISCKVSWVHSILKARKVLPNDWQLTQCLFGEYLLNKYPQKRVALVEAEKTAIICAALMPQYLWLATGGKTQLGDKLKVLKGRDVIAFPDVDGYDVWKEKLYGTGIKVSDWLEQNATIEDRARGVDIADILLRNHNNSTESTSAFRLSAPDTILKYFSESSHNEIKAFIDDFELIPISITKLPQ